MSFLDRFSHLTSATTNPIKQKSPKKRKKQKIPSFSNLKENCASDDFDLHLTLEESETTPSKNDKIFKFSTPQTPHKICRILTLGIEEDSLRDFEACFSPNRDLITQQPSPHKSQDLMELLSCGPNAFASRFINNTNNDLEMDDFNSLIEVHHEPDETNSSQNLFDTIVSTKDTYISSYESPTHTPETSRICSINQTIQSINESEMKHFKKKLNSKKHGILDQFYKSLKERNADVTAWIDGKKHHILGKATEHDKIITIVDYREVYGKIRVEFTFDQVEDDSHQKINVMLLDEEFRDILEVGAKYEANFQCDSLVTELEIVHFPDKKLRLLKTK